MSVGFTIWKTSSLNLSCIKFLRKTDFLPAEMKLLGCEKFLVGDRFFTIHLLSVFPMEIVGSQLFWNDTRNGTMVFWKTVPGNIEIGMVLKMIVDEEGRAKHLKGIKVKIGS